MRLTGPELVTGVGAIALLLVYCAVVLAGAFLPVVAIWWLLTH